MSEEKRNKVLIVDDDEFLLNMYSVKFSKGGIEVYTAETPNKALEKLREGLKPDALILDIVMPEMDGFDLLSKIRQEDLAREAIVLVLTNQGQTSDINRAKDLGVNGYIVKASTIPSEVLSEVKRALAAAHKN